MQSYIEIAGTTTVKDSRAQLLNNDKTIMSCSAGAAFPTADLQVGMLCYRTDLVATFQLQSTSPVTWFQMNNEVPPGFVSHYAVSTPPVGWLKCNGAAISRTAYANLFAVIGTKFGVGDNSTTFNVPELRGEFVRGLDDSRGIDSNRASGSYQAGAVQSHTHGVTDPSHAHSLYDPGHVHSAWTDAQGTHNHTNGVYSNDQENGGYGLAVSSAFGGRVAIVGFNGNFGTANAGNHGHNVGIGNAGTGMSVYGAGTGISIVAAGDVETRPRNVALLACIKY